MADGTDDKDHEDDGPSLELPSFGFARRRRKEPRASSPPAVPATPDPGPEVPATPDPGPEVPATPAPDLPTSPDPGPEVTPGAEPDVPAPRPGPGPDGEPGPGPEIEPGGPERPPTPPQEPEVDPLLPGGPPPPTPGPEIDPLIPTRPEFQPDPEGLAAPTPAPTPGPTPPDVEPATPAPEPHVAPDPDPEPEALPDPNDPDPVAPPPPAEGSAREPSSRRSGTALATPPASRHADDVRDADDVRGADDLRDAARTPRQLRFPVLRPFPAVLLVGLVVGLTAVLLTYGSLRLCDAATGTASCGGGPGLLMLLAIVITLTYLGGWLLRGFGIDDAGSTSFLAVGLVTLVAMLFLVDSLDERSGAVAVPVVTVLAYALSWRVTAALVDADADQG